MAVVATRDDSRPDAVDAGGRIAMDESHGAPGTVIGTVDGAALDPQRGSEPRRRGEDGMSERTTGATPQQIEAAAIRGSGHTPETWRGTSDAYQDQETTWWRGVTKHIVPPDHRIIGPEDIAAVAHVTRDYARLAATAMALRDWVTDPVLIAEADGLVASLETCDDDVARLAALIGDDTNG
jgi:hypothetical protein